MSRKFKVIGLALAAVMAFSAIAASAANAEFAPRWKVAGAFLGSGVTSNYSATLKSGTTAKLTVPGLLTLTSTNCTASGKIVGSAEKVSGTHKEGVLGCTGVKVEGAAACVVGNITTVKMDGTLGWMEEVPATPNPNVITFTPESGTQFVKVIISECALEGEYAITGATIGTLTPSESSVTTGTLTFGGADTTTTEHYFSPVTKEKGKRTTVSSPKLLFGGRAAALDAEFSVGLTSGQTVGVFAG